MESWSFPPSYDENYLPPADSRYWFPRRETMPAGEREKAILAGLQQAAGFRPSDNRQLISVRLTSLLLEKFRVKSDPDLSPAERAARLEVLERRQVELEQTAR